MKAFIRIAIGAMLVANGLVASAQQYKIVFAPEGRTDTVLYIARQFRDQLRMVDTAHRGAKGYVFEGKTGLPRGMYVLVAQDGKSHIAEFCVDRSRRFTISGDSKLSAASVKVHGCESNAAVFAYMAVEAAARQEMDEIEQMKKSATTRAEAERREQALIERMTAYESTARHPKRSNIYFSLLNICDAPEVADSIEDKPLWYRTHYWDALFASRTSTNPQQWNSEVSVSELLYSPQFFSKLNYFFYGLLYYADADTICREVDRLVERIGNDTAMLRYVFDHIEPRYFRSTKNIGWDAVWCHLARQYYLAGRCPWATEGTLYNMKYNCNRIEQSLIGAHGQELWMADTNQSPNPADWISSHRFPEPYVILWFWDPDCHHCQEQSAQLQVLYDSLHAAGVRRFEVYAVGYESDVEKWKRYVREHNFPFVNVGGTNVNIDYQEAYNVHGAPTMIILNRQRDIIMNKVLPVNSIMTFLDSYEKRHGIN